MYNKRLKWECSYLVFDKQRKQRDGYWDDSTPSRSPERSKVAGGGLGKENEASQSILIFSSGTDLPYMNIYQVEEIRKEGSRYTKLISFFLKLLPYRSYSYTWLRMTK